MKWIVTALLVLTTPLLATAGPALELKKGDHVCIVGNTLADRMQHHGWLETLLYARHPQQDLVVRNLGFAADELTQRMRSANFGSPDEWLTATQADVVFAFFGYNESFGAAAGLDRFKKDLDTYVKHITGKNFSGKGNARIVLFSPIAHEDLHDRNLPDGKANNERLKLYTAAMAEVAKANNVPFVDLFTPTLAYYPKADKPLTINGIHLNEHGDQIVAGIIDEALFGKVAQRDPVALEKLRAAVLDKAWYWFERYRVVDGYSVFGGRADLRFVDGQTNRVVMDRELKVLEVMTANRDQRVWAVAKGGDLKVDDNNTPPFIPVKTNKPGPLNGGKHLFLDGEESIKKMTVGKGLKVNLFASEKEFPELTNAVQMTFDPQGRLWVAVWPTYPHWKPKEEMNDKILILEDTKGTGKADKCTVFADGLHCPTGFEFCNGGVLVAQAPDIMFLKDTKGTGKADLRVRVLSGMDSADTHHTSNSFTRDPAGGIYWQEGTFHRTQVETPYGPPQRCADAGVYRYEPRTQNFDVYVTYGFANPHGHIFDRWGQDIVVDGTGAQPYHAALFSGHLDYPFKHAHPPQVYQQRTRPCAGIEILSSRHFPPEFQGNLLVTNVIGFQGILRYKLEAKGGSIVGTEQEPLLSSSDPNFRPSDVKVGPDGAVYFTDWHNPIIGHMQHNLRDPSRDREHGRIYRITYDGRDLLKPVKIAGEPVAKLLDLLKEPEDRVRYRARIELDTRPSDEVIPLAGKWLAALDKKDADYEHHALEILWLHQAHNVVNVDLLKQALASSDFKARAAATRVLCYWRDRVPDSLEIFKKLAADAHPRVRLEAVRAASFFKVPEAVEVPLTAAEQESDPYVDFVRDETMKALDPIVKSALAEGRPIAVTTEAGARYFLRSMTLERLVALPRTRAIDLELLIRPNVRDEVRRDALRDLAKRDDKPEPRILLDILTAIDTRKDSRDDSVILDLVRLLTARPAAELTGVRADIEKLALSANQPVIRQIGFVALINIDGSADKAWTLALKSAAALRDLVSAVPLIADPSLRATLYARVEPLLDGLPKELAGPSGKEVLGRYVRIELPGNQRTLTLAEVEVFSGGRNVARQGLATQKNTAHGGDASKAIDGNKSPIYGDGGQTHTLENTPDPWWEVDLRNEFPIESVLVFNRTDGSLGDRLAGFTLKVLDKDRKVVFERTKQPAPTPRAIFVVGVDSPERAVRHAAMLALTSVRGQEGKTFRSLARFLSVEGDRAAAIRAIQRLPRDAWPKDEAGALLDTLLAHIRKIPPAQRTTASALEELDLADALAGLLPADEAKKVRTQLGELGVRVLRVGTLPERMAYDKDVLVVKAGKPVEILFENSDLMPHNLVVLQPGSLEEIGMAAETSATEPGAQARHFVPVSKKVLLSSTLLQPRESQQLSFTAPMQPGVYPVVCTYPGHWRRMYAALYVVADLDAYQAGPEAYLLGHPELKARDPLLADRRPRTEWKFDDLASTVADLKERSYGNGKQMFTVASCVSCHKMEGMGNEFGPDLVKLDPKMMPPVELLRHILEPSLRIDDKYATYLFELKSGKTVTGMILEETPDTVKLIENPLAKTEARTIKKSEIATRQKSPVSLMPKGLLDKLSREEVLDLIAYVAAHGDRNHPLFRGGQEHHH